MKIELEGMEFKAYHGCLEYEREQGNLFMVDFCGNVDCRQSTADPFESDDLCDTVDYGAVYDLIAAEMAVPSNLLEHVAGRIALSIRGAYPQFTSFSVRVSKRNPPVNGKCAWSRVTVSYPEDF